MVYLYSTLVQEEHEMKCHNKLHTVEELLSGTYVLVLQFTCVYLYLGGGERGGKEEEKNERMMLLEWSEMYLSLSSIKIQNTCKQDLFYYDTSRISSL